MTNMQTDYDVKLCLQRLRGRGGFLPKGALRSVMENWSLMVEPMRAELELLAQNPEESRKHSGNLSLYALYLVAYFKEKSCVESLCKILLHDGEWLDAWLDTTVEEDLCRIMAALLDAKQLRVLVDSRDVWWLGRATALEAMFILVMRGEYDREAMLEYCAELLGRRHREDSYFMGAVVTILSRLYPDAELRREIHQAYAEETVENLLIDERDIWDQVERYTEEEWLDQMRAQYAPPMGDPIALLSRLDRFEATRHIGRNETCPCGSGALYKHCCA